MAMEEASNEALAGAGVAPEQDGRESLTWPEPREEPTELVPERSNGRALAEQFGQFVHSPARN